MTRYLILGGAGAVGRELAEALSGDEVWLGGRNRVLLEELSERTGCDWVRVDLDDAGGGSLPTVDVLVDLTYAPAALPRVVLQRANRAAQFIESYLARHRSARAVHASSWVVGATQREPMGLSKRLAWGDGYALAKTAGEKALARRWVDGRMRVLRLGNVVTGDTAWGDPAARAPRACRGEP